MLNRQTYTDTPQAVAGIEAVKLTHRKEVNAHNEAR